MNIYRTEAIVLKDYDLGEQDKIVALYSRKYGKIKVVAKGARGIKSRFASLIQPLSYNSLLIYKNRKEGLDILSECVAKYQFLKIKKDLVKFAYACYLTELIDKLTEEEESQFLLFQLLLRALFILEETSQCSINLLIEGFQLKLLSILGYRPYLERCVNCGKDISSVSSFYFSLKLGGLLCNNCQNVDEKKIGFSREAFLLMKRLLFLSLEKIPEQKKDGNIEKEVEILLRTYFSYWGQIRMPTRCFIHSFEELDLMKQGDISETGRRD